MDSIGFVLTVVKRLRYVKEYYTYEQLERITGLSKSTLCRYIKGEILPSLETAKKIFSKIREFVDVKRIVGERVRIVNGNVVDVSNLISDPLVLDIVADEFKSRFSSEKITKLLTVEAGGVPLATAIALKYSYKLVVAKRYKDPATSSCYVENYHSTSPYTTVALYVAKNKLKRKDKVVIVTDVIRTGRTVEALSRIVRRAGADLLGTFSIVLLENDNMKAALEDLRVEPILVL